MVTQCRAVGTVIPAPRNKSGNSKTSSKTVSIATSHQPSLALDRRPAHNRGTWSTGCEFALRCNYWQSRNIADGARFSLDGTYGLAQVDVLISQNKFDEAGAALKTAQNSCANCHKVHRDKAADGSFTIK